MGRLGRGSSKLALAGTVGYEMVRTGGLQNGPGQPILTAGIRVPDEDIRTYPSSTDGSLIHRVPMHVRLPPPSPQSGTHLRPQSGTHLRPQSGIHLRPPSDVRICRLPAWHTPSPASGIRLRQYDNQRR